VCCNKKHSNSLKSFAKNEKMKSNYFLIIFLLIAFSSFGQASTESTMTPATFDTLGPCNPEAIFIVLDKKPQYKSGLSGLESEINAEYKPDINIDGVVYVQFVINCKGQVSGVKVLRGINTATDSRIIKELILHQNWQPGYQNVPVDYRIKLSIRIKSGQITIAETE
jgi:hypothetical protein